ncbi:MAG: alkaline phosphatase [Thermoguttaceae bacterium]|nr:alkaline phosphatase [Thermoguttaceae bacterium]
MLKKFFVIAAGALVALATTAFVVAQDAPKSPTGVKHVVWIGSDGFGAHYVNWDELPNLKKMKENGSWTLHMRSVLPSSSAINWHTMLVGAPSEMHGYRNWNSKEPEIEAIYVNERGYFPDVFRVLRDALPESRLTAVYNWDGIGFCFDKEAADDAVFVEDEMFEGVYNKALEQLDTKPTFAFIYFGQPDHTGHTIGWGTPEYQAMLTKVDEYVGKILQHLEENGMMEDTVVYFTSDHGGSDKGHGEGRLDHMEVPYLVYGKGIKVGEITGATANFDAPATALSILGVEQPQCWRGKPADVLDK